MECPYHNLESSALFLASFLAIISLLSSLNVTKICPHRQPTTSFTHNQHSKPKAPPLTQNHTNISKNPHENTTLLHNIPPKKLPSFPIPNLAPPFSLSAPPAGFHR